MNPAQTPPPLWVTLSPAGRRVSVPADSTILAAAQAAGIEVNAVCGGKGTCGGCKVQTVSGQYSPHSTEEKAFLLPKDKETGMRLACQTTLLSDAVVQFPPESLGAQQRLQLEGTQTVQSVQPAVRRLEVELSAPTAGEKQSDAEKVREALKVSGYPLTDLPDELLPELLGILQKNNYRVSLVLHGQDLVTTLPPGQKMAGLAVDIGTTKLAAYLVDLQTGETLASGGTVNPQIAYGEDVIARIQYTDEHPDGAKLLQQVLVRSLNDLVLELTQKTALTPAQVTDCVMVGNTAMHHLLAGLPLHSLGTAPYHPARIEAMNFAAREIGLRLAHGARVYLPPNIAGFVGGDHIAMLLSTRTRHTLKTVLAMDIGTNTEISLVHKGRHLACSCASGPAFEGAHIRDGLRAVPGAIERVFIDNEGVRVQTVNHQPAIGICGSGMLDAVAEMRKANLVDARGVFRKEDARFTWQDGQPRFVVAAAEQSGSGREITIDRKDVQEIQLAKAAIRSGAEVLMRQADIQADEIDLFLVAGAFGTYLDVKNCLRIGMFPDLPLERFKQVGNAAGSGARELLVSTLKREEAEAMIEHIEYVELTTVSDYVDFFTDAIGL